jgi:hypothetical protein
MFSSSSAQALIALLTANNKYFFANFTFLLVLFLFAFGVIYLLRKKGNPKISVLLLLYHTGMSVSYYFLAWPGFDTNTYYVTALSGSSVYDFFEVGGGWVSLILYLPIRYIHLSYFSGFMLFNVIGFIGLLFFYITLKELIQGHDRAVKLLNLVVFFPGLSYWTAPISKESIVFLGIMLIFYALIKLHQRIIYFALGSLPLALIRPHVFVMIILALLVAMLFLAKTKLIQKLIFIPLLFILMVPAYSLLLQRTQLETINVDTAEEFIEERGVNWGGGSGVDIQNYNSLFKLFTYLYRPLFVDIHNVPTALASCENLFYLIITWQMLSFKFIRFVRKEKNLFLSFNLLFFFIGAVLMSHTEGNLGTAMRHKVMIMPSLLALFLLYRAKTKPLPVKQNNFATPLITDSPEKVG